MADDNYQAKSTDKNYTTNESLDLSEMEFYIDAADITIISLLSKGADSNVYTGLYKKKAVAVKVLNGSAFVDDEKEIFTRQVEILKRVNHSNIVKFIGASVKYGNWMMIVFELVGNSVNVQRYLKSDMPKQLASVVNIALLASKAMEYLHSQGIIHRNLFSSNILVAQHVVKLTSFIEAIGGLVDEEGTTKLRKMDVFYFGEILYELLDSVTDSQPLKDCLLGLSSSQKDKIPESLVELVVACLSRDPENRPEFTLIALTLESILSTINRAVDLDLGYGDLISEIPFPTVCEEMYKSRHDADNQVEHQNTVEPIEPTPETALPMSTELMDGGTLEEYMLELKPDVPNNTTASKLALRISEAMQHLHAQGITHRDLKSRHVFLKKDKDFFSLGGLEHREDKTDEMDLEHFKADVYNFSQILWELLTNNHTPFQAYASSLKEKRPILEGVPYEMLALSICCWSDKAEERPDFIHITATLTKLLNKKTL